MQALTLKPAPMNKAITLRPITISDMDTVVSWFNKPHLDEYFRRFPPLMDWNTPEIFMQLMGVAYLVKQGETPVGLVQLIVEDIKSRSVNLGVLVDKDVTDSFTTSRAIYDSVLEYVFIQSNFNRLIIRVLAHREKLVNRLSPGNWQKEGELRQSCLYRGNFVNEVVLSLLKEDYLKWRQENQC